MIDNCVANYTPKIRLVHIAFLSEVFERDAFTVERDFAGDVITVDGFETGGVDLISPLALVSLWTKSLVHGLFTAGLRHAMGPCIRSCSSIEAPMQVIRAPSASEDATVRSIGPSASKDGWGLLVAFRYPLTISVFSKMRVASDRIREALFILVK